MTLPTLYKRTTTGAIQEWTIVVKGDAYHTISGQHNGKLVVSKPTICIGKNSGKKHATTGEEQAAKEARAKWKQKTEKGYTEELEAIDKTGFREPMRAKEFSEYGDELTYPAAIQPKLDGIRCVANGSGLWTRNGKAIAAAPHIQATLAPLFKKYPHIEFDGELYSHDYRENFDGLVSIIRKSILTDEDLELSRDVLEFWIFDIIDHKNPDATFAQRSELLEELIAELNEEKIHYCVQLVETVTVNNREELDARYSEFREEGFEGAMIRVISSAYQFKRTKDLLKRKEFVTDEFEILDVIEGVGNRAGGAGKLVLKTKDDLTFESNLIGGHDFYARVLRDKEQCKGKLATVRYQNWTPGGRPRFPEVLTIRDYE